jgi:hypothetical protein
LRLHPNKKKGTIILPLVTKPNQTIPQALQEQELEILWEILQSLLEQNDANHLLENPKELSEAITQKVEVLDQDATSLEEVRKLTTHAKENIQLRIIKSLQTEWEVFYGKLKKVYEKTGIADVEDIMTLAGETPQTPLKAWIEEQRKNRPSPNRVAQLNQIGFQWTNLKGQERFIREAIQDYQTRIEALGGKNLLQTLPKEEGVPPLESLENSKATRQQKVFYKFCTACYLLHSRKQNYVTKPLQTWFGMDLGTSKPTKSTTVDPDTRVVYYTNLVHKTTGQPLVETLKPQGSTYVPTSSKPITNFRPDILKSAQSALWERRHIPSGFSLRNSAELAQAITNKITDCLRNQTTLHNWEELLTIPFQEEQQPSDNPLPEKIRYYINIVYAHNGEPVIVNTSGKTPLTTIDPNKHRVSEKLWPPAKPIPEKGFLLLETVEAQKHLRACVERFLLKKSTNWKATLEVEAHYKKTWEQNPSEPKPPKNLPLLKHRYETYKGNDKGVITRFLHPETLLPYVNFAGRSIPLNQFEENVPVIYNPEEQVTNALPLTKENPFLSLALNAYKTKDYKAAIIAWKQAANWETTKR